MRALGANQLGVIRGMQDRPLKGWYPGCGWLWSTYSGTVRICRSLVKHGLVVEKSHNWFTLTPAGESVVAR